jgi:hypothetical protein
LKKVGANESPIMLGAEQSGAQATSWQGPPCEKRFFSLLAAGAGLPVSGAAGSVEPSAAWGACPEAVEADHAEQGVSPGNWQTGHDGQVCTPPR